MKIVDAIGKGRLFFDGGMGSMLQAAGLPEGLLPDIWCIERPEAVESVHRAFLRAGSRVLTSNSFGASEEKLAPYACSVERLMEAAVGCARRAMEAEGVAAFVAADIGPTGRLLAPYGDLDFEDALSHFARLCRAAERSGADCILIETMSDLYEMKAAVLAAKENSSLPILATLVFDAGGKLLTGGSPAAATALLEGLGVAAFGVNCGLGPLQIGPVMEELRRHSSLPLICQPNAGLPETVQGKTAYRLSPEEFAREMQALAPFAAVLGGCCGTTPAHLAAMIAACREIPLLPRPQSERLLVSSYSQAVVLGEGPVIIGERINPTGKKRLQEALRAGDRDYVLRQALDQEEAGAEILDVNVGLPGLDEVSLLTQTAEAIQTVTGLPLQLDSSDPAAMERAMRRYNGKPLVNSVTGEEESLSAILPLVKHYGGGLICLCLDEDGIPETAQGRLAIAARIAARAEAYGIPRRELLIDGLTLPVSAGDENGAVTLETLRGAKALGLKTALGVSNVSFGLPRRELLGSSFFTLALEAGLDGAIINPNSAEMMDAYHAWRALKGLDTNCADYIAAYQTYKAPAQAAAAAAAEPAGEGLAGAVKRGLRDAALREAARALEAGGAVLDVINSQLIPALDEVGRGFEAGRVFLPQLLMSAEAAKAAFEILQRALPTQEAQSDEWVVLATVKGDIHDIGKNIVKVLLESYRFRVLDLGKDVTAETIVEAAREHEIRLVGLSALMTTTAPQMEKTIALLRAAGLNCKVMVGGAVITADYAAAIGADHYAPDALSGVHYAEQVFAREASAGAAH